MYPLMSSQSVVIMKVDMKICNLSLLVYFDTVGMWWEDKVVPVLINKPQYHKDKWEVKVQLHNFLIVAIDADEWTHSQPKCFILRERALCTQTKQGEAQSQFRWYREEKIFCCC